MPDDTKLHWTENEDLLSRYVLDRLSKDERTQLESHLLTCPQCSDAVRQERELVSGIRQYGREEIKSRLKHQLAAQAEERRSFVTWQRALSAAAVLVVVAGIGIYNRWFPWKEQKTPVLTEELQRQPEAASESEAGTGQPKDEGTLDQQVRQKASGEDKIAKKSQMEEKVEPTFGISKPQVDQSGGLKKLENAVSAPTAGGAVSAERELGKEQNAVMTAQPSTTEFWIEGKILEGVNHVEVRKESGGKRLMIESNVPKSKESAEKRSQHPTPALFLDQDAFSISQQHVGLLPPARQQLQQAMGQSVQAHVQPSDRGVSLTLYPGTLFNEEDVRNARVEEINPDSLVVVLNSRRIGFRMPAGFLESQAAIQKAKQK